MNQNYQHLDASTCTSRPNDTYFESRPTTRSGIESVKDMVVEDRTRTNLEQKHCHIGKIKAPQREEKEK